MKSIISRLSVRLRRQDVLSLGWAFVFFYILMFWGMPIVKFLHLPSAIIADKLFLVPSGRLLAVLTSGLLAFIFGYWGLGVIFAGRVSLSTLRKPWLKRNAIGTFVLLEAVNIALKLTAICEGVYKHIGRGSFAGSPIYGVMGYFSWVGVLAIGVASIMHFEDLKSRGWKLCVLISIFAETTYGLFSGSKFEAIVPLVACLLVVAYRDKRALSRIVVAGGIALAILMPLANFFNMPINFFNAHSSGITFYNIAEHAIDSSIGSINQLFIIKPVVERTDSYLYGKDYKDFFVILGPPRFIWRDKPITSAGGNKLGKELGIVPVGGITTIGPTVVGDWYMNFGIWGVIFGMALIGFIWRLIYSLLITNSGRSPSGVLMYIVVWFVLMLSLLVWVVPVYAGLIKTGVLLFGIHYLLTKNGLFGRDSEEGTGQAVANS